MQKKYCAPTNHDFWQTAYKMATNAECYSLTFINWVSVCCVFCSYMCSLLSCLSISHCVSCAFVICHWRIYLLTYLLQILYLIIIIIVVVLVVVKLVLRRGNSSSENVTRRRRPVLSDRQDLQDCVKKWVFRFNFFNFGALTNFLHYITDGVWR